MSDINEILKNINSLTILKNQIELLKLKKNNCLRLSMNGGIFSISSQLISLVKIYIDNGYSNAVFLDKNDTPIMIQNLDDFLEKMLERQIEVLNEYYVEYEKLKRRKSPVEWLDVE